MEGEGRRLMAKCREVERAVKERHERDGGIAERAQHSN